MRKYIKIFSVIISVMVMISASSVCRAVENEGASYILGDQSKPGQEEGDGPDILDAAHIQKHLAAMDCPDGIGQPIKKNY